MQSRQLLKVRESADALNCSVPMVRKMIKAGSLPAVRVGRAIRVPASAVDALVAGGPAAVMVEMAKAEIAADAGRDLDSDLTALKTQVADLVKAELSTSLDLRLAQIQQEINELRHEVYPRSVA